MNLKNPIIVELENYLIVLMKNFYFAFCFILTWSSCSYIYYPTHPVIPEIKKTGLGVEASIGPVGAQVSSWYTFNKNLYLVANFSANMSLQNDGDSTNRKHYNSIATLGGIGVKFQVSKNCDIHLQTGAGISKGYFRTTFFDDNSLDKPYTSYSKEVNVKCESYRYYLQPVIGLRGKQEHGGIFLIPKITYESFKFVEPHPTYGFNENYKNVRPLKTIDVWIYELYFLKRYKIGQNLLVDLNLGLSSDFLKRTASKENNFLASMYVSEPVLLRLGICKQF